MIEHGYTGCTGLTGRELPAREASSGDDPVRYCGFPALEASRFLKRILCILCIHVNKPSTHACLGTGLQPTEVMGLSHPRARAGLPGHSRVDPAEPSRFVSLRGSLFFRLFQVRTSRPCLEADGLGRWGTGGRLLKCRGSKARVKAIELEGGRTVGAAAESVLKANRRRLASRAMAGLHNRA